METSEKLLDRQGEFTIDGHVFRPVYKHVLDNMPRDLVQKMACRRLAELEAHNAEQKNA
ncbi:MAG: hypothetical protein LBD20_09835 [Spirochaetaceae bacterium]|jgi:hypothetical protein|nr:hypothetical protein [Spirochaetaceae bacterium]